jgi:hypothetical protein
MEDKIIEETTVETQLAQLKDRYRLDTTIQVKRGAFSDDYILAEGEPGYHTTTHEFKIGDGTTTWNALPLANEFSFDAYNTAGEPVVEHDKEALKNSLTNYADDKAILTEEQIDDLKDIVNKFYAAQEEHDDTYGNKFLVQFAGPEDNNTQEVRIGGQSVYSAKKELIGELDDTIEINAKNGTDSVISYGQPTLHGIKNYVLDADIFKIDRETTNTAFGIDINSDLNNMTTHDILKMMLYPPIRHSASGNGFALVATENIIGDGNWCNTPTGSTSNTNKKGIYKTFSKVNCKITRGSEAISEVKLHLITSSQAAADDSLLIAYFRVNKDGTMFTPYIRKLDDTGWVRARNADGQELTIEPTLPSGRSVLKTGDTITLTFDLWNWIVNTHFKNFADGTYTVNQENVNNFWKKFVDNVAPWCNLHTKYDSKKFALDVKSDTSNSQKVNYSSSNIVSNAQFINPLYYGYFKAPAVTGGSYNLLISEDWKMPASGDTGGNLGGVTEILAGVGSRTIGFIVPTNTYVAYLFPRSNTVKSIEDLEVNVNADNAFEKNVAVNVTVLDHSITIDGTTGMAIYNDTTNSGQYYICIYKSPVDRSEGLGTVGNTYDYKFNY